MSSAGHSPGTSPPVALAGRVVVIPPSHGPRPDQLRESLAPGCR